MLRWVKHEKKILTNPNRIHMPKRPPPLLLQLHPPSFLSSNTNEKGRETGRNNPPPESCCKNSAWFGFFFLLLSGEGIFGKSRELQVRCKPSSCAKMSRIPQKPPSPPAHGTLGSPRGLPGQHRVETETTEARKSD